MVFKCQEDSFLKEFTAKVLSCEKAEFTGDDGLVKSGFNLVLNDTILFPEGGGQPCDYGTINGQPVWSVRREGSKAVHFVETDKPFEINEDVQQSLSWERRLDHMQQHSGQHLITAIFDQEFGYDTKSWWLGTETSYIEINAKEVTKEQIIHVEKLVNDLIIEGRLVSVQVTTKEKGLEYQDVRAPRGLPNDHVGPVRVVNIEGIESNMCCGTHVRNISQLQCIKLLHIEKTKTKLLLHFLVGNRVLKKLEECYNRETKLNTILKGGPSSHVDLIMKMQTNQKTLQKNFQKLLKDFATLEAKTLHKINPLPKFYCLHRQDGIESDFINTFLRNAPDDVFYFLTVSDPITMKGHMTLRGHNDEIVKLFGVTFCDLLDGKGNGKGKLYQAKVNNLKKLSECEEKLKKYFEEPTNGTSQ